jgi:hypothetical protein
VRLITVEPQNQPQPQNIAQLPVINPTPEEAEIGPIRRLQRSNKRKQLSEDSNKSAINAQVATAIDVFGNEQRIYRTTRTADWLVPFDRRSHTDAEQPGDICK